MVSASLKKILTKLTPLYTKLYPKSPTNLLEGFVNELEISRLNVENNLNFGKNPDGWYKEAIVYSLYVDLFSKDFHGLKSRLDYILDLGANCLWLLPIFESPMKDGGYDVKDYYQIRQDLLGMEIDQWKLFQEFIYEAHKRNIRIIIDMPFNHTSDEHEWFIKDSEKCDQDYEHFYIWNHDDDKYKEAKIIFEGISKSNWTKRGDSSYYFHRFFSQQPDLNYQNPKVLIRICKIIAQWCENGIDGFRLDAIPFLWKEDGHSCENHVNTHMLIEFFRAVIDHIRPGIMLLAESCQDPKDLIEYFGQGDDKCHAAYHFPLMPKIFLAMARNDHHPITEAILDTPNIPSLCQWFVMLRCHDELTFELLTQDERGELFDYYCKEEQWSFRNRKGISARLAELFDHDPVRLKLVNSILLTLCGTPILFYGDEFMKPNDHTFYKEMTTWSGIPDSRYLCRGRIDWEQVEHVLNRKDSNEYQLYSDIKEKLQIRHKFKHIFRTNNLELCINKNEKLLVYKRWSEENAVIFLHNLSKETQTYQFDHDVVNLFASESISSKTIITLGSYQHSWYICK